MTYYPKSNTYQGTQTARIKAKSANFPLNTVNSAYFTMTGTVPCVLKAAPAGYVSMLLIEQVSQIRMQYQFSWLSITSVEALTPSTSNLTLYRTTLWQSVGSSKLMKFQSERKLIYRQ